MQLGLVWCSMNTEPVFPGSVLFAASRMLNTAVFADGGSSWGQACTQNAGVLEVTLQRVRVDASAFRYYFLEVAVLLAPSMCRCRCRCQTVKTSA